MIEPSLLHRAFQCWNSPIEIKAGEFAHLSARGVWRDGRCIVTVVEATEAMVVELPEADCKVDVDQGWITVIVPGPATIPARATVCVKIRADIAQVPWLEEVATKAEIDVEHLL